MGSRGGKILLDSKGGEGEIYWFVDGELALPSENSGKVWWQMKEGRHKISAADASGSSAHVWITVRSGSAEELKEELPLLEEVQ
jgi:membrane carboxypeptidase/penicillin-binding protein PbpC